MNKLPKTIFGIACLAALAIGQEPVRYGQPQIEPTPPVYVQPIPDLTLPDGVGQDPAIETEPVSEPVDFQEPTNPVTPPDALEPRTEPIEPLPALEPLPDTGPSLNDWAPVPPGEMNPRTGMIEPDWNNIGTGIPDYSKPYDPKDDPEVKAKREEKCKYHRFGWSRTDGDWEWCPMHPPFMD